MVILEIHSVIVIPNHHLKKLFMMILVIHHLAVLMLNVRMESVHVYQNTKEIHIEVVDQNVP
jgi:hypothetical protein